MNTEQKFVCFYLPKNTFVIYDYVYIFYFWNNTRTYYLYGYGWVLSYSAESEYWTLLGICIANEQGAYWGGSVE